jgi:hypothetical protein
MSKWHGSRWGRLRVIRARKAGCRLGGGLVSGMVRVGSLKLVTGIDEQVAGLDVDELLAWMWVGSLRLVPWLEEQVVFEEVLEIAGCASDMSVDRIVQVNSC